MSAPGDCFQTLDVTRFRRALANLHERVGEMKGRVEVTRRGSDDVCVLISKAELESLEAALEILARSAEYKAMCDIVTQLAMATGTPVPPVCAQA